jgi:putative transcriptional regulator
MRSEEDINSLIELGSRIRSFRLKTGYNQTEFANIIGKDQPSLNRLENGKINPGYLYLKSIANALNIKISDLF